VDIDTLIVHARGILQRNLDNYPAFDPTMPYDEKDKYILDVSQLTGALFSHKGTTSAAERFYRTMVDDIHAYEVRTGKLFNKGVVYANLGIALIAIANLDEGIHYLLRANEQDAVFHPDPHGVLNGDLWKQFEDRHVLAHLLQLNGDADASLTFVVTEIFILDFLKRLDVADRLLLEATIWTLHRNLEFNQKNSNDYTRGRLFSGLKDLCLLTETLLRKKQVAAGTIQANTQIMLGDRGGTPGLLTNALAGLNIGYPYANMSTRANSLTEFLNNLEPILNTTASPEIRRVYCLHLVRNFTGHHFDVSSHIRSINGHDFFDLYEKTIKNILSAILYFAEKGAM
jgi:hypothetical protein